MKYFFFPIALGLLISQTARATVILDDTWADGTRTDTSLPTESAWFTSSAATLATAVGYLTGTVATASSSSWLTYFTANTASPVELAVGETLKVTVVFTPSGVAAANANRSFRVGLFDYADGGTRATGDGGAVSTGTGVLGYMLNMNFGSLFGAANALQINRRTNLASANLMSASGDYTTLSTGGGNAVNDPGLSNNVTYTLIFSVARNDAGSVDVTTIVTGGSLNISNSVNDASSTNVYRFDAFSLRPSRADQSATNFVFTEFKVEVLSGSATAPSITTQPTNQSAFIGQNVSFAVGATGSAPLSYQWYFNTNTTVANATNSTLTLNNVQTTNAGNYSVVVTNSSGSVTSSFATLTVFTNTSGPAIQLQVLSASVKIRFQAEAGGSYELQRSTNLPMWATVGSTNPAASGTVEMTDNSTGPGVAPWQSYYRVKVLSSGSNSSSAPSITTQPTNLTVVVGQNATFNSAADGTAPLRYQWYFNAINAVASATNAALTVNSVTTNDAGSYSVIVTNSSGAATSAIATLTVNPTPVAPSITTQPTNLTVLAGQNATFAAAASGTAPLKYQWFFNTNTALANATNATLTISNAQGSDAGGYSVRVTNSAGSVTSVIAALTVNVPPAITNQPQNQTVSEGLSATFTLASDGTAPLKYQWYFNTNTPLANATNASFSISTVTSNDAGAYSAIVTNNFGSTTSSIATLTVNPSNATPDFSMIGFATLSGFSSNGTLQTGGTTGGGAGPTVVASNLTWLVNYAERSNMALQILVISNIDCSTLSNHHGGFPANYPTGEILVSSNKTIYSTNGVTISRGSFRIGKASNGKDNIIIRNLKFRDLWVFDPSGNYDTYGWDYIGLEGGSHHVWIDHCDFEQVYDGMVDIVHASDYVTVSWNVFRTQKKCSLIGHSDSGTAEAEDTGHLNVTFHHNYYVDVEERMPRMRFGNAHVFNLYCENLGGNGIQSTASAATLVENSYFHHPQSGSLPTREENGGPTGTVKVVNSVIVNLPGGSVAFRQFGQTNFMFNAPFVGSNAPYAYSNLLDAVSNVPSIVTNYAGVNKVAILP